MIVEISDRSAFLQVEARALWERVNTLKERDRENLVTIGKLFVFFAIYCAAPLSFSSLPQTGFLSVWTLGGAWFALSLWYITDRSFRGYGFHLKERLMCLRQLSAMRLMLMGEEATYVAKSLLPLGEFGKQRSRKGDFPERLVNSHLRASAYFFKFISLIPLGSLSAFAVFALAPEKVLEKQGAEVLELLARSALAFSGLFFLWIFVSHRACAQVQRVAFAARRIGPEYPWPRYFKPQIRRLRGKARMLAHRLFVAEVAILSVLCVMEGVPILIQPGTMLWSSQALLSAFLITAALVASFIYLERDLSVNLLIAHYLWPIGHDASARTDRDKIRKKVRNRIRKEVNKSVAAGVVLGLLLTLAILNKLAEYFPGVSFV